MKPIVALTDFSPVSLNAVNYAADMARATRASLILLHISIIPLAFSEVPYPPENIADLEKEANEKMQQLQKDLESRTGGNIKIHSQVRVGSFLSETMEFCKSRNPFAVVLGTQGSSAIERAICGSNTINATKHLPWPVIAIPPQARFTTIKNIGLACDMKDVAETTPVEMIKGFIKQFNAHLTIVYMNRKLEPAYDSEMIEESGLLHEMIEDLHPSYRSLNNMDMQDGLNEFAKSNKLDLLIIIPKKHNLLEKLFHKSQSKKLLLHTHIPVMSVLEK